MTQRPYVSLVIPAYNEENNLLLLYQEIASALARESAPYEIVLVDDGSTDGSGEVIEGLARRDARVRPVRLRRRMGKSIALAVGFRHARGDTVVMMDADLQDDPMEIPRFVKALNSGAQVVCGWRRQRHDPLMKRLFSRFYNWTTRLVTGVKLNDFNCGFKAYRKVALQDIRLYGDLHRYIPVLAAWQGFQIAEIEVQHHPRRHGESKYGFGRVFHGFLDLLTVLFLTRFEKRPLHLLGGIGLLMTSLGMLINTYLAALWFLDLGPVGTRPLLALGVLLCIVGFQFLFFGILAEFLLHLHHEQDDGYLDRVLQTRSEPSGGGAEFVSLRFEEARAAGAE